MLLIERLNNQAKTIRKLQSDNSVLLGDIAALNKENEELRALLNPPADTALVMLTPHSFETLTARGWTEEMLIEHGLAKRVIVEITTTDTVCDECDTPNLCVLCPRYKFK